MLQCTVGDDGSVGIISCMSIFSACFGLLTRRQLAATTWSGQIWISCWILPHFDVRTISVAWKLKKLSNIFWQKIFFLLNPPSKGLAHCALLRLQKWWCSSVRALPRCRRREAGRRARWLSGFGCRSWRAQPRAVLNISFTSHQPSHAQCHEYPHHVTRHNLNGHISSTALEARKWTEWI